MKRIVLTAMVAGMVTMGGGSAMAHSKEDILLLSKTLAALATQIGQLIDATAKMKKQHECGIDDNATAILTTNVLMRQNSIAMRKLLKQKLTLQSQQKGCDYPTTKGLLQ